MICQFLPKVKLYSPVGNSAELAKKLEYLAVDCRASERGGGVVRKKNFHTQTERETETVKHTQRHTAS